MLRKFLFLALLYFPVMAYSQADSLKIKEIMNYRAELNKEFADSTQSPLTKEDLKTFKELEFYPIDLKYYVTGAFKLTPDAKPFKMKTTTERTPEYVKYGEVTFSIDGKSYKLSVYRNIKLSEKDEYKDYLFIPFNDYTNGNGSYGGGRYLDVKIPKGNELIVDFNKAYNPYCSYNHKYYCPIPPDENKLEVEINAGVKAYH